jgi:flagellar biosynthesis protein FlhA
VQQIVGSTQEIPVAVVDPSLEQLLLRTLQGAEDGQPGFEPGLAEKLQQALAETAMQQEAQGHEPILLVAANLRTWMARIVRQAAPGMHVLSYNEVPENRRVKVVASVGGA